MYFKLRLADLVIGVECLYETTRIFCRDYLSEDMPVDFEVKITDEDIMNERKDNCQDKYRENYLETLALLRKIAKYLPKYDCFLMHGAVVVANG